MSMGKYKNVKLQEYAHTLLKQISLNTGIGVGKLVLMGVEKIIEEYEDGEFDKVISKNKSRIRRDGTLIRGS